MMAIEVLKISGEAKNKAEIADNERQGIRDTLEGVSDRARIVDNILIPGSKIEVSEVDGMRPTSSIIHLPLSISCV
jgi:hypothetical protein